MAINALSTAQSASNTAASFSSNITTALINASNANSTAISASNIANNALLIAQGASNTAAGFNINITDAQTNASNANSLAVSANNIAITTSNNSFLSWTNIGRAQYTYTSNIGVGTSNPLSRLHMTHTFFTTSNPMLFEVGSTADGSNIGWSGINFNGYGAQRISTAKNRWRVAVDQTSSNDSLVIDCFNGSTTTTVLNARSNGYVGIGKSNPLYALDVIGDVNITGVIRQNGTSTASWINQTSNVYIIGSNVAIGKSNASSALDVNGTITANIVSASSITAVNLPSKILSGNVFVSSNASATIFTLSAANAGNFYSLYLGPASNYPYFLTANVFYWSASNSLVYQVTASNIDLNISASTSNLLLSIISSPGMLLPWSLYKM